jgi:hypothetical protein
MEELPIVLSEPPATPAGLYISDILRMEPSFF